MKNRFTKRNLTNDESAIAPAIVALIIMGVALVGTVGAVAYFTQPDITYNISEGGLFSIAGLELSGLEIILAVCGILFAIVYFFRKK